ncbi:3-hydroxybutyrate dehydrogenase [Actinomadura sp. NPDC047616]|uniref:3-hydroxybutyrate dehydrogenase n=1 Tax=Actinomadura sp. NPDC047616 TaxID=3155914 RepID=UPI0034101F50
MTSVHPQTAAVANLDLSGRRALVTGGAGGIGLACAERLAAAGAQVVIVDLRGDEARAAAERLGGTARVADLADPAQLDALARDCEADIIVNNAGIQHVAPLEEFPPEMFSAIMRIMVEAPFRLVRAALPGMYARGWGRVVNISSVHGLRASPYKGAYVAAKHALEGLSKVIALEGAPHGVTSNCVCPAYVRTPLVEGQIADQARVHGMSPDAVTAEVLLARTAIKRLIEPEEVAAAVAYLCAPEAAMITGASITLDGGWTAH